MPELPEVESIRRTLLPHLIGRRVQTVAVRRRDVIVAPGEPVRSSRNRAVARVGVTRGELLVGRTISVVRRHGKQLAVIADDRSAVIVQLGMSGQFFVAEPGTPAAARDHVHVEWSLAPAGDSAETLLCFRDPRRFGCLRVVQDRDDLERLWVRLGPDALSVMPGELRSSLDGSSRPIKPALLDQSLVAGVGNIYADEALFAARIHPCRPSGSLTPAELARLCNAIKQVMTAAIDAGGSTLRDYVDANGQAGSHQNKHSVYGRAGEPCRICGSTLYGFRLGQRATVVCQRCQPVPRRSKSGQIRG